MGAKVDLNDLATFVRVANAGSFSGAARQIGVPTSTVSRAVARLEDSLGVVLLQRTTRRVALTREGRWLRERSHGAIGSLESAAEAVRDLQGQPQGVLRIAAPQDIGHNIVAQLIQRYSQRYPAVRIELEFSGRLVDLVAEGFDVALRAGALRDSSLIARKVGDLRAYVVATPGYLQVHGSPRRPEELAAHECALFRGKDGSQVWTLTRAKEGAAGRKGRDSTLRVEVHGRVDSDDFGYNREFILQGGCLGMLPHLLCRDDLREGRLVNALPEYVLREGALYVIYPSTRNLSPKVKAFRELAIETLSED